MKKNKTIHSTSIITNNLNNESNSSETTLSTVDKLPALTDFDLDIALSIGSFINARCLFCDHSTDCSVEEKKAMLNDDDAEQRTFTKVCKDFKISPFLCGKAIEHFLEDHPEHKQHIIEIEPTYDPFADLKPGEIAF